MPEWLSGDLLLFSGHGLVSSVIRFGTCSRYSHVGIVCNTPRDLIVLAGTLQSTGRQAASGTETFDGQQPLPHPPADWQTRPLLYESTTLNDLPCAVMRRTVRGVQAHDVAERIQSYDGRVWRLRLAPDYRLTDDLEQRLALHLLPRLGRPYDRRQAVCSGFRSSRLCPCLGWQDDREEFCAELVVGALKVLGLWPIDESASIFTPGIVARRLQKSGVYHDLVRVN